MVRQQIGSVITTLLVGGALFTTATAANQMGDAVVLRALDKVTATTQDFTVAIGESLNYGSLTVDVKHCEKKPPEDIPETFAFLQIFDKRSDGKGQEVEPETVFSGWMLASKPAVSALDHPVYDVWVVDCKVKPVTRPALRPNPADEN